MALTPAEPQAAAGEETLCCELPASAHAATAAALMPLPREKAQRLAEYISYLADPNRLRILSLLAQQEMCVGDLAITLAMSESAVSHQLRTLRAIRLVSARKQGRHVFYQLQDQHVLSFYQAVLEHLEEAEAKSLD